MPTKPEMRTLSVDELREGAATLVRQVGKTQQPVRIAADGQPPVVLLDEATYDWHIHLINFARLISEGMEDVRAGRAIPLDQFLREFADAKNGPG